MSTFKKHVGRIRNTDRRCVVVYMQIPGNEENALIVDTDALPDRFHDALMDILDSKEGQETPNLHTLLARRILPDLGLDMMNALHTYGFLRPVEIDNVVMYPAPNAPCPLRTIVDFMNGNDAPKEQPANLENRVLENQKSDSQQAQLDIAQNILRQAQDLEDEANRKREQAYRLVPELRPASVAQVTDSPAVTEASAPAEPVTQDYLDEHHAADEGMIVEQPIVAPQTLAEAHEEPEASDTPLVPELVVDASLPDDVKAALEAAHNDFQTFTAEEEVVEEPEGNQVDTSDEALQAFLDRAAFREDRADKEKWEAMQPKKPVGRPRKDGQPAGTKPGELAAPVTPAPKKRGRPPKAKL